MTVGDGDDEHVPNEPELRFVREILCLEQRLEMLLIGISCVQLYAINM